MKHSIKKYDNDPQLKDSLGHYKPGLIYENAGKVKEAEKKYDKTIFLLPDCAPACLRILTDS